MVSSGGGDTDFGALERKYISITPLHCDMTNHGFLGALFSMERELS